jgi:hypothetical protein
MGKTVQKVSVAMVGEKSETPLQRELWKKEKNESRNVSISPSVIANKFKIKKKRSNESSNSINDKYKHDSTKTCNNNGAKQRRTQIRIDTFDKDNNKKSTPKGH